MISVIVFELEIWHGVWFYVVIGHWGRYLNLCNKQKQLYNRSNWHLYGIADGRILKCKNAVMFKMWIVAQRSSKFLKSKVIK